MTPVVVVDVLVDGQALVEDLGGNVGISDGLFGPMLVNGSHTAALLACRQKKSYLTAELAQNVGLQVQVHVHVSVQDHVGLHLLQGQVGLLLLDGGSRLDGDVDVGSQHLDGLVARGLRVANSDVGAPSTTQAAHAASTASQDARETTNLVVLASGQEDGLQSDILGEGVGGVNAEGLLGQVGDGVRVLQDLLQNLHHVLGDALTRVRVP